MLNELISHFLAELAPIAAGMPAQSLGLWVPLLMVGFLAGLAVRMMMLSSLRQKHRFTRDLERQLVSGKSIWEALDVVLPDASAPVGKGARSGKATAGKASRTGTAPKPARRETGSRNAELRAVIEEMMKAAAEAGQSSAAIVERLLSSRRGFLPSAGKLALAGGVPRFLVIGGLFSAAVGVMHTLGTFDPASASDAGALRVGLEQFHRELAMVAAVGLVGALCSAAMAVLSLTASPSRLAEQIRHGFARVLELSRGEKADQKSGATKEDEPAKSARPAWSQAKTAPSQEFPPTASIPIVAKTATEEDEVTGEMDMDGATPADLPKAVPIPKSVEMPKPVPFTSLPEIEQTAAKPIPTSETRPAEDLSDNLSDLGLDLNPPAGRSDGALETVPKPLTGEMTAEDGGAELWDAKKEASPAPRDIRKEETFSGLSMEESAPRGDRDLAFDGPTAANDSGQERARNGIVLSDEQVAKLEENLWASAPAPSGEPPSPKAAAAEKKLLEETSALMEEEEVTRDFPLMGAMKEDLPGDLHEDFTEATNPGISAEALWNSSPPLETPVKPGAAPATPVAKKEETLESFEALFASVKLEEEGELPPMPVDMGAAPNATHDPDTVTMHEISLEDMQKDEMQKLESDLPRLDVQPPMAKGAGETKPGSDAKPKPAPHSLQDQVDDYLQAGRESVQSKERVAQLMREQTDLDHAIETAYQDRLAGKISEEMFNEKHRKWKEMKARNEAELTSLRSTGDPKAA